MPSEDQTKTPYHHGDLRRALLLAAEHELTEKGVEGFTLRGCAKRAGVSHAAPAHHFKDASGLLTALAAEGFRRFVAAMLARRDQAPDDPVERRLAIGLGYIDFARANPALFRLMHSSFRPDFDSQELKAAGETAFSILVEAVCEVRGENALQSPEGRTDIIATWASAHGIADLLLSSRMPFAEMEGTESEEYLRTVLARMLPRPPSHTD